MKRVAIEAGDLIALRACGSGAVRKPRVQLLAAEGCTVVAQNIHVSGEIV